MARPRDPFPKMPVALRLEARTIVKYQEIKARYGKGKDLAQLLQDAIRLEITRITEDYNTELLPEWAKEKMNKLGLKVGELNKKIYDLEEAKGNGKSENE